MNPNAIGTRLILAFLVVQFTSTAWGNKKPIPPDEPKGKATAFIREIFEDEYAGAVSSRAKSKLAETLIEAGRKTTEDDVGQFALLEAAYEIAAEASNVELAFRAIDELGARFTVNVTEMKHAVLLRLLESDEAPELQRTLVEKVTALLKDAIELGQFNTAVDVAAAWERHVRRTRNKELLAAFEAVADEAAKLKNQFAQVEDAIRTLETSPADADANLTVGTYLCFYKNQWDDGLPLLEQGSDQMLKELANLELDAAQRIADTRRLGDAWWSWAEQSSSASRNAAALRSVYWYQRLLDGLQGEAPEQVLSRIERAPLNASFGQVLIAVPMKDQAASEALRLAGLRTIPKVICFSPDGKLLAAGDDRGIVCIWALRTGRKIHDFQAHPKYVSAMSFSPDGRLLGTVGFDQDVTVWDAITSRRLHRLDVSDNASPVDQILFLQENRLIVGKEYRRIKFWNLADNSTGVNPVNILPNACISHDGRFIVTPNDDGNITMWEAKRRRKLREFEPAMPKYARCAISQDGRLVAAVPLVATNIDDKLRVWDAQTGKLVHAFDELKDRRIETLVFSQDSRFLASTFNLWNLKTGRDVPEFKPRYAVALSPDSRYMATAGEYNTVSVRMLPGPK